MRVRDFNQINSESQVIVVGAVNQANEAHVLAVNAEGRLLVDSQTSFSPAKISYPIRIVNDHSINQIGASWFEIVSNTGTGAVVDIKIFDSSGEIIELGVGSAGNEQTILLIPPGGISASIHISENSRLAIRSYTGSTVSVGTMILQLGKEVVV